MTKKKKTKGQTIFYLLNTTQKTKDRGIPPAPLMAPIALPPGILASEDFY